MDKPDQQPGLLSRAVEPADLSAGPPVERRAGKDRRSAEIGPPSKRERRTTLEARKPQVVEVDLSPSEWALFSDSPPTQDTSGH